MAEEFNAGQELRTGECRGQAEAGQEAAPRFPEPELRRELEQIERKIANIAAEREFLDAEPDDPAQESRLAGRRARLSRDADALEARWMEVGTAIEAEAEAKSETDDADEPRPSMAKTPCAVMLASSDPRRLLMWAACGFWNSVESRCPPGGTLPRFPPDWHGRVAGGLHRRFAAARSATLERSWAKLIDRFPEQTVVLDEYALWQPAFSGHLLNSAPDASVPTSEFSWSPPIPAAKSTAARQRPL